jgi:hypothetical protein
MQFLYFYRVIDGNSRAAGCDNTGRVLIEGVGEDSAAGNLGCDGSSQRAWAISSIVNVSLIFIMT